MSYMVRQEEVANNLSQGRISVRAIMVGFVIVVAGVIFLIVRGMSTPDPVFPSLVNAPDPSLHGTVAYYDNPSRCVRVISASGAKSKDVMCMPEFDPNKSKTGGKPVGWNLTWRADNRLEITEFVMIDTGGAPTFKPGWQKVVEVIGGAVEQVPVAQIALLPTPGIRTTTSPTGDVVSYTSDGGSVAVNLRKATGAERALLKAKGNPETYGLNSVAWSPDFKWVAVDDDHLLITTIDDPSTTRTLTPPLQSDYGYDALHWFDITAADLLK